MCPARNTPAAEHLSTMYRISRILTSSLEPRQILPQILKETVEVTNASAGSIILIDQTRECLKIEANWGLDPKKAKSMKLPLGQGITGWVAKNGQALLVPDVHRDERYVVLKKEVQSEMAVPFIVDEKIIGVMNVDSEKINNFQKEDMNLLQGIAGLSSQVIQNIQLYANLKRQTSKLEALIEISAAFSSSLDVSEVLNRIVSQAVRLMNTQMCSLMLLDKQSGELILRAVHGGSDSYRMKPNLEINWSLIGQVVKEKKPIIADDVRKHPLFKYIDLARQDNLCSLLSVPLLAKGELLGVLNTYSKEPRNFEEWSVKLFESLASHGAIAIENARLYEQMFQIEEQFRLREKAAAIGQLTAGVAHEIRNPLGCLQGTAQLLKEELSENKNVARYCNVMIEETQKINDALHTLLEKSRPRKESYQKINLTKIIQDAAKVMEPSFRIHHTLFESKLPNEPLPVYGDRELLYQVFINLFLNSQQAGENKKTKISIFAARENKKIKCVIEDNGPGMSKEIQKQIFKAFFTTKAQGTGLGMSIVKDVIQAHNGSISLDSSPGQGTRITLEFPCHSPKEEDR